MKSKDLMMRWLLGGVVASFGAGYTVPEPAGAACQKCRRYSGTGCMETRNKEAGYEQCDDVNHPCRLFGDPCGGATC